MPSKKEQLKIRIEDDDDDIREWIEPFRATNQLSAIIRLLIIERAGAPIPPDLEMLARQLGPPAAGVNEDAIDELRAELTDFNARLTVLEQVSAQSDEIDALWRKLNKLEARLTAGAMPRPETLPEERDEDREAEASSRLKKISFGGL